MLWGGMGLSTMTRASKTKFHGVKLVGPSYSQTRYSIHCCDLKPFYLGENRIIEPPVVDDNVSPIIEDNAVNGCGWYRWYTVNRCLFHSIRHDDTTSQVDEQPMTKIVSRKNRPHRWRNRRTDAMTQEVEVSEYERIAQPGRRPNRIGAFAPNKRTFDMNAKSMYKYFIGIGCNTVWNGSVVCCCLSMTKLMTEMALFDLGSIRFDIFSGPISQMIHHKECVLLPSTPTS